MSRRVLIVAERLQVQRALESVLRAEGIQTQCVSRGADALSCLQLSPPDLVLTAFVESKTDSIGLLRAINTHGDWAKIPVAILTDTEASRVGSSVEPKAFVRELVVSKVLAALNSARQEVEPLASGSEYRSPAQNSSIAVKRGQSQWKGQPRLGSRRA